MNVGPATETFGPDPMDQEERVRKEIWYFSARVINRKGHQSQPFDGFTTPYMEFKHPPTYFLNADPAVTKVRH